jgi:hypothetical protein
MQFNHGTKHEALIVKDVYGTFKRVVNWRKFKKKKQKKKGT